MLICSTYYCIYLSFLCIGKQSTTYFAILSKCPEKCAYTAAHTGTQTHSNNTMTNFMTKMAALITEQVNKRSKYEKRYMRKSEIRLAVRQERNENFDVGQGGKKLINSVLHHCSVSQ